MNPQKWLNERNIGIALIVLVGLNAILAVFLVFRVSRPSAAPMAAQASSTPSPQEMEPSATPPEKATSTPIPVSAQGLAQTGAIILSMSDGNFYHLFAYHPQYLPLTRLTSDAWDDINPAISPDGSKLAFSSRRNGFWDIYILDLSNGQTTQITNTPDYEGSPTWSSDEQWLAYESNKNGHLDIYLSSLADPTQGPIQLTDGEGINYSPSWSPGGREIAFVSTRSGDPEIWLAKLDEVDQRYTNLSRSADTEESHPVWSPDGTQLAWSSNDGNQDSLHIWNANDENAASRQTFAGSWPAWDPTGILLATAIRNPNGTDLAIFSLQDNRQSTAQTNLPGSINGITWLPGSHTGYLNSYLANATNLAPAPTLFVAKPTQTPGPGGRKGVVPLPNVDAPYAFLQDLAIDSYDALRAAIGATTGWDFLAQLENAYLPLTEPPAPAGAENWLFSGRGIAVNALPIQAGWMVVTREDFNGVPYWRVYLKALKQDGSQGVPLAEMIWDFNPRFQGDPIAYEMGGKKVDPPGGWWVDFTELALRYGWDRLSAMSNWRTYYTGTRFNQFIFGGDLDWKKAMEELYPPEAIATYTPIPTITQTLTRTPWKAPTKTATRTGTPTRTPSPTSDPTQ